MMVAMSVATKTRLLTFEEFERLPDRAGKDELLEGELIELPPADFKHNRIALRIYRLLDTAVEAANARGEAAALGEVYIEMGYKLGQNYVQPDVSVTHAGQAVEMYLMSAPAIAIEVVSPGNTARVLGIKTELYFRFGALEVWRLYPKTRHVARQVAGSPHTTTEREAVRTPLLPDFELKIQEILGS